MRSGARLLAALAVAGWLLGADASAGRAQVDEPAAAGSADAELFEIEAQIAGLERAIAHDRGRLIELVAEIEAPPLRDVPELREIVERLPELDRRLAWQRVLRERHLARLGD